jgi:hypothetical protein
MEQFLTKPFIVDPEDSAPLLQKPILGHNQESVPSSYHFYNPFPSTQFYVYPNLSRSHLLIYLVDIYLWFRLLVAMSMKRRMTD